MNHRKKDGVRMEDTGFSYDHSSNPYEFTSLADLVKTRRQYMGMSVRQLAVEVGCSYQFVSMLETGAKTWTDRVEQFAASLDVPVGAINRFRPTKP